MHGKSVSAIVTIILAILIGTMGANAADKVTGINTPTAQTGSDGVKAMQTQDSPLAPVGSGFTYQGRLTSSGSPANGQFDITFTLWDTASGGAQVGGIVTMSSQAV